MLSWWKDRPDGIRSIIKIGGIEIECFAHDKPYKDGTRLYSIWLYVPGSSSKEIITVTKVRGNLDYAKLKAEEFIQKIKEDLV